MILDVLIEGRLAGRVELHGRGVASLRYEASYVHGDRATPLSTLFPLDDVLVHSGEGVHDWLMGLLPDDERVLGSWHAKHGVEMSRPLELLGTEIGVECAGAAQFCPPERTAGLLERIGGVHPMRDDQVLECLLRLREDPAYRPEGYDPAGGASLTGKQPKIGLRSTADGWALPWGAEPTSHILKISRGGERFEHESLMQHIVMGAAGRLGMRVPLTRMLCADDLEAVVVTRYDRFRDAGGDLRRLHQEDLCQASGRHPRAKYQRLGGAGPGELAALMRTVSGREDGEAMVRGLRDMMGLQWLVVNNDLHSKNLSLVLSGGGGRWRRSMTPVRRCPIASTTTSPSCGCKWSRVAATTSLTSTQPNRSPRPPDRWGSTRLRQRHASRRWPPCSRTRWLQPSKICPRRCSLCRWWPAITPTRQTAPEPANRQPPPHAARQPRRIPSTLVPCMHSLGIATDPADTPDTAAIPAPTDDAADQKAEPCGATTISGVCSNQVLPNTGRCQAGHTPAR